MPLKVLFWGGATFNRFTPKTKKPSNAFEGVFFLGGGFQTAVGESLGRSL